MNKRRRVRNDSSDDLSAWLELGATGECLALAKQILRQRPISAYAFAEAVDVILCEGDGLARFKRTIITAFHALPKRGRQAAEEKLFWFLVSNKDWKDALKFLPKRPKSAASILLGMRALLEQKRMNEAEQLSLIAMRRLKAGDNDFSESCFCEAIASFNYAREQWELAFLFWDYGSDLLPFAADAIEGRLKARLRMELADLREAGSRIQELNEPLDEPLSVYVHSRELTPQLKKRLASHESRLEKLFRQIEKDSAIRKRDARS